MVRYNIRVDRQELALGVVEQGGKLLVEADGEQVAIDLRQVEKSDVYSLMVGNRSYEVLAREQRSGLFHVMIDGFLYEVEIKPEAQPLPAEAVPKVSLEGEIVLKSPMISFVVEVSVASGDRVEEGAKLLVLEAMKMQNHLTAPRAGVVKSVHVTKGQTVKQGDTLIVLA